MESPLNSVDFGSHEPWWNTECEESFRLLYEAKTNLEKNPSKENGLALSRRKTAMGRKIAYAERLYATNIQMSQKHCYSRKYGNPEQMERKLKKKKKKTIKSDGTESEGDNLDLTQEMFSLSHYICDQEELVNQMFATIRGSKLDAMLPPVLKSIPLQEIKKLCLHELRGMSKKRILCTINGEAMEGSSDSEEEEEEDKEAISSEDDNLRNTTIPVKRKVTDTDKNNENSSNSRGLPAYLMKTIKVEQLDDDVPGDKSTTRGKKSVMELLELQMRARIIKTMLEKGDDGKTLTEDAIVALMGSATQEGKIPGVVKVEKDLNVSQAKSKNDLHQEQVEMTNEVERMEGGSNERTGRRHRGDGGRHSSSHRKDHIRKSSDGKKGSKRQRSTEVREKNEDDEKRSRRDRSSDKRSRKKKKITRKEFEERMKRAKKNRTYRQRKSSEDEGKANALKEKESSKGEQINTEGKVDTNSNSNIKNTEGDAAAVSEKEQGEAVSEKEEGEAASEKEEGEWDSNEEEEGACSPSDISSRSYYSSSQSYSSRSRSRSYSRSWSRSPNRGRGRGRSKSLSRSRSRSKSKERRKRDGGGRWEKKRSRDHHSSSGNKKMSSGIVSLPSSGNQKQQQQKEEEDNWGQSCDIEFVDSEEDFDDNTTEVAKNTVSSKKPLPVKGQYSERASISFSLQKKVVPNITQNVDLDDLPMKSSSLNVNKVRKTMEDLEVLTNKRQAENPEEIIDLDSPKMISDEILISSDSENELKDTVKAKSVRVEKRELVHSAKEFQSSTGKDKSGPGKKRETVVTDNLQVDNRNLATSPGVLDLRINDEIINQTTSQGTDLRGNDEITNKLSGDQETELERHITSQQQIDDGTCAVIEGDEENQTEKSDINKKVESEDVNAGGDVETQGNYNIQKSSNTEDNEIIDVETLDTVDKNIDVDTVGKSIGVDLVDKSIGVDAVDKCLDDDGQRTEFSSETGKKDSKEPVQANITVKNVTESEVVTAHGSENKDGLNNSSGIPQEYQTESEPSSYPDGNVSDLNKEVENKEKDSVVSETINTLDKTQEHKISKEKKTGTKEPNIPKVKEIVYSGTKEPKFSKQDTVSSGSKEPTVSEENESASSSKRKCKMSKEKVTASSGEKESNISKEETATIGEKTLTAVRKKVTASSGSKEPTGSQENDPSFSSKRKRKISKEKVIAGSGKKVTRKVKLEHLQESYNEEQESHLQESYEEQKSSLHAERNLQDAENGFSHEISQEMKEACKETTIEIDEECKETQNDEETRIDGETHIDVEAHNDGELEKVEEKQEIKVSKSDEVQQEDTKEIDNIESKETTENFYSGADELTFSDDDTGSKDVVEDIIQDDREVEPIRIDTGLIRKRVTRSRKVEMTAPNKSWTKKEKKKREKMEGIGLLKTTLAENVQSLASKEEEDNQSKLQDLCKEKETTNQGNDDDTCASWGISSISSRDEMSVDSRIHSPKEAVLQSVEMSPKVGKSENNELQEDETSQKRIGQDTEIIGVIETSTDPTTDQMEGIDLGGSSWSMRWLQSEKVQKVVSSSKMLSRVRKKIQKKDKATKVVMAAVPPVVPQKKMPEPVVPIIGSIEEYERLFGMKAKKQPDTAASTLKESAEISAASAEVSEQPPVTQETEQLPEKCPTFGSDDEGEDSEEEALWSKIIGN